MTRPALALLSALVAAGLAPAQTPAPFPPPTNPNVIRKYDANKDGVLDEAELAVWRADEEKTRAERAAREAAELARYDANGNGVLDPEERQARDADRRRADEERKATADAKRAADEAKKAAAAQAAADAEARFQAALPSLVSTDARGRLVPATVPAAPAFLNPVHSEAWLDAHRSRVDRVLRASVTQRFGFNTHFENEKYALGQAMARTLAGDFFGFSKLYEEDVNRDWHARTAGIDFYACFVIKHQTRKYFHFGPLLPPGYLARMKEGARLWTEVEPNRRKSDLVKPGAKGFAPDAVNSWVDTRTTDNLSMMRFTSVYLFAEESGSADVTAAYKRRLVRFATALFRAGNGEWDSENYLGHTITPAFNIHDFAKDPEVRAAGKAMLDWWLAATAVKYYRGGAAGPNCRDYNHVQPFGGSLTEYGWFYFGAPLQPDHFEYDQVHALTSAYVPPPAIVNLGTQNFERPRELLNTKPPYHEPQAGDYWKPAAYHETYYYGRTFTLGTLAEGSAPGGDTNGFKLVWDDPERGVADLRFAPTHDPIFTGSAVYKKDKIAHRNRAAQNREVALFLVKADQAPWRVTLPLTVQAEVVNNITFLRGATTWAAIHPVNLVGALGPDEEATRGIQFTERTQRRTVETRDPATGAVTKERKDVTETVPLHQSHHALAGLGRPSGGLSGFVLEVGEAPAFADYESFKKAVLAKAKLDVSALANGTVAYTGAGGRSLAATWGDSLADFKVLRDGRFHDWAEHGKYVWRETGKGPEGLIHQLRGPDGGTLTVNAGGKTFVGTVSKEGAYTFENK
jgi:hypothetical protein